MTDDDKREAGRKAKHASNELEDAADLVDNDAQSKHLEDLAEEAEKTGETLEDQADSE